jgi:NADH-quinone oxidoreductase subunit L
LLWVTGALAAACTSFYMVRLTYLVFFGQSRVEHAHHHGHGHDDHHHGHEIHENPWTMTLPLVLLAIFSIVGGYVSLPHAIMHVLGIEASDNLITQWLYPVISSAKEVMKAVHGDTHGSAALEWGLMGTSTLVMLIMSGFAISLYKAGPQGGNSIAQAVGGLYRLILDKWRIDELYQAAIIEPLKKVGDGFFKFGDRAVIEGIINEGPRGIYLVTSVLSDIQTGLVRNYLKLVFVAVIALGAWIFI